MKWHSGSFARVKLYFQLSWKHGDILKLLSTINDIDYTICALRKVLKQRGLNRNKNEPDSAEETSLIHWSKSSTSYSHAGWMPRGCWVDAGWCLDATEIVALRHVFIMLCLSSSVVGTQRDSLVTVKLHYS